MISEIVRNIIPSGTVAINSKVLALIDRGEEIINLSVGEPDFDTPEPIKKAAFNAMMENKTKYDKVPGLVELRKAICDKLKNQNNLDYNIDEIVVCSGAKQCITNICFTLLNEGDEVIIPSPYWVTYPEIVKIAKGVPVFAKTSRKNDFKISAQDIERYATEKTKMLVLCNPSNPLGTEHTRRELKEILDICLEKRIYILADEVYERICFDDAFVSIASLSKEAHDYILIINALSKAGPMTGWRIGYTASNRDFAAAMTSLQGHLCSHPSTISQWGAVEALTNPECIDYTEMMVKAFKERRDFAVKYLREKLPQVSFIEPKGAFFIFIDISAFKNKFPDATSYSTDFALDLLTKKKVAITPGIAFGQEGFFRLAFSRELEELQEGLKRIKEFCDEL